MKIEIDTSTTENGYYTLVKEDRKKAIMSTDTMNKIMDELH